MVKFQSLHFAMDLGLWHRATPASQFGRVVPTKLADLHALTRSPENPRGKRVHFLDAEVSSSEAKSARTQKDSRCLGLRQLCRGKVARSSKRTAKSSGKSSLGSNGRRIVACAAGSSGEAESSSPGGLLWQPFWNSVENVETNSLEFSGGDNGGGDGNGNGGKGGDGSSGGDGSGSGRFDPSRDVSSVGEEKESGDEEQAPVMRSMDFRAPVLASLSSAAGDSLGGEAPFGELLRGRMWKSGAADETAAKTPSRSSDKGRLVEFMANLTRLHRIISLINGSHEERSGKKLTVLEIKCLEYELSFLWLM